jgi:hypothetical protein
MMGKKIECLIPLFHYSRIPIFFVFSVTSVAKKAEKIGWGPSLGPILFLLCRWEAALALFLTFVHPLRAQFRPLGQL